MSEENNRDNLETEVPENEITEVIEDISDGVIEQAVLDDSSESDTEMTEEKMSGEETTLTEDPAETGDEVTAEQLVPVAETDVQSETDAKPGKKKKGIIGKIFKGIGILLLLAFLAAVGFVGYKVWLYLQVYVYSNVNPMPSTFSNETISLSIDSAELIDEIIGFELDEEYVYVGVKYTITNISEEAVQWKAFPLLSVNEYVPSEDEKKPGYVLVENTAQAYELNGLRNYGIHQEIDFRNAIDDLASGESRVTADIFKILKTDYAAKEYFLTTDIFNEIVDLPDLEIEDAVTDGTTTDDTTVTQ